MGKQKNISHLVSEIIREDGFSPTPGLTFLQNYLHHSIANKHTSLQVPAKIPQEKEIVREVREVPVPVEVPTPYTPRWVWWVLGWAVVSSVVIVLVFLLIFRK